MPSPVTPLLPSLADLEKVPSKTHQHHIKINGKPRVDPSKCFLHPKHGTSKSVMVEFFHKYLLPKNFDVLSTETSLITGDSWQASLAG